MGVPDHLLRTFAAVAPGTAVLDVACDAGECLVPLAQLGLAVTGVVREAGDEARLHQTLEEVGGTAEIVRADPARLPLEDDAFAWVVADRVLDDYSQAERLALLAEWRRLLAPGGWLYVTVGAAMAPEALTALLAQAHFAVAEAARVDPAAHVTRGIYRRVEASTIS